MKEKKRSKNIIDKIKVQTILISVLIIFFGVLILSAIMVYTFDLDNKFSKNILKAIPFPAAVVNGKIIYISELKGNTLSVKRFYETQDFGNVGLRVDFTTKEGEKRLKVKEKMLLEKMIENAVIQNIAEKKGIKITQKRVDHEVERKLNEYGSEDRVRKELKELYGWSIDDFKNKVVKPSLYASELKKIFEKTNENELKNRAMLKISEAENEIKDGGNFSEVAKKYSDGQSSLNNGEIGWVERSQIMPELTEAIFRLNKGEISGILASELGYHIIKMDDIKKGDEENNDLVKISQIFVKKTTFADWLTEEKKKINIYILLKEYSWNKKESSVEFTNRDMIEFEKSMKIME